MPTAPNRGPQGSVQQLAVNMSSLCHPYTQNLSSGEKKLQNLLFIQNLLLYFFTITSHQEVNNITSTKEGKKGPSC